MIPRQEHKWLAKKGKGITVFLLTFNGVVTNKLLDDSNCGRRERAIGKIKTSYEQFSL